MTTSKDVSAKNIVLIGMPGVGKSTLGVLLAKQLSKTFVDTDLLIQLRQKTTLQTIVDNHGYMRLREVEESEIVRLQEQNAVIATGGSAVYSEKAMKHLRENGTIIYLKLGIAELLKRINDWETRGLAKPKDQSFEDLYKERTALYEKYGEFVVDCSGKTHEEIVAEMVARVCKGGNAFYE
jgi:shikimate kinase